MTTPYVQGELINPAKMFDRIESRLKALETAGTETGWTAVTLASTVNGTSAAADRIGREVKVRGQISPKTSWAANTAYPAVITMPAGFRPSPSGPDYFRQAATNNQNATVRLQLKAADGTVDMITGATAPTSVDLSALSGFLAETT